MSGRHRPLLLYNKCDMDEISYEKWRGELILDGVTTLGHNLNHAIF